MRRKSINIVNRICMKFHFDISFFQKYFYGIFHIRCCDMRNMFRKSSFLLHYFPRDMLCQKVSLNVASTPTDKTFNLNWSDWTKVAATHNGISPTTAKMKRKKFACADGEKLFVKKLWKFLWERKTEENESERGFQSTCSWNHILKSLKKLNLN